MLPGKHQGFIQVYMLQSHFRYAFLTGLPRPGVQADIHLLFQIQPLMNLLFVKFFVD